MGSGGEKCCILSWIGYAPLSSCSEPFNLPKRLVLLQPRCLVHNSAGTASSLPSKSDDDLLWWTIVTRMSKKHPHSYVTVLQKIQSNVWKAQPLMEIANLLNVIFSCNVPTQCTCNASYHSHFTPTSFFGMTMPSAGSTYRAYNRLC
jgi:hypothetical protein